MYALQLSKSLVLKIAVFWDVMPVVWWKSTYMSEEYTVFNFRTVNQTQGKLVLTEGRNTRTGDVCGTIMCLGNILLLYVWYVSICFIGKLFSGASNYTVVYKVRG